MASMTVTEALANFRKIEEQLNKNRCVAMIPIKVRGLWKGTQEQRRDSAGRLTQCQGKRIAGSEFCFGHTHCEIRPYTVGECLDSKS